MEAIASYSCLLPRTISTSSPNRPLLVWYGFLQCLQFFIFPRLVLHVLHILVTLPMLHLCFTTVQQLGILFLLLQDLCSSSPCRGLRDLVQESSTSLRTLNQLRLLLLMHFLYLFLLIFLSFFSFSHHSYHFCIESSRPGWIHAFSESATNSSATHHRFSASTLPFDLNFFVISFITIIMFRCTFLFDKPHTCFHLINPCRRVFSAPSLLPETIFWRRCDACQFIFLCFFRNIARAGSISPVSRASSSRLLDKRISCPLSLALQE